MLRLRRLALLLLAALALGANAACTPPSQAVPGTRSARVLIVSIDGLRPDIALRANMPTLRRLLSEGSFTFFAETTDLAVTLPSHVSMLTGNPPEVHGVTWHDDREPRRPEVPTLFEVAHRAGYTTAMVSGKAKFRALALAGGLDW